MLTLEQIVEKLEDRNIRIIAERTGVSYHTVLNIQNGKNTNPTVTTLRAISDYLEGVKK